MIGTPDTGGVEAIMAKRASAWSQEYIQLNSHLGMNVPSLHHVSCVSSHTIRTSFPVVSSTVLFTR